MGKDGSRSNNGFLVGWVGIGEKMVKCEWDGGIRVEVRSSYINGEGGEYVTFGLLDWGAEVGMCSITNGKVYLSVVRMDEVIVGVKWMNY